MKNYFWYFFRTMRTVIWLTRMLTPIAIAVYAKSIPIELPDVFGRTAIPLAVVTLPVINVDSDPRPYIAYSSLNYFNFETRHKKKRASPSASNNISI